MSGDVAALEVLFSLYVLLVAALIWTSPTPRKRAEYWSDDLFEDDVDAELARILDGER